MEKKINLPTREQVEKIWNQYHTPLHIREHMRQVNRVAVFLAERLLQAGKSVRIDLVDRASLLHDTIRVTDWEKLSFHCFTYKPGLADIAVWNSQREQYSPDIPHTQVNYEIFHRDFPEMAQVILVHDIKSTSLLQGWEEKVVNYADRRVAHDKIVTVEDRINEGISRYNKEHNKSIEQDSELTKLIYQLEEEIYSVIGGSPDKLQQELKQFDDAKSNQKNEYQESTVG